MFQNRRGFLKTGAAALTAGPGILKAERRSQRPNIVMVLSNDITRRDFGCYGNKTVRTPNLDELVQDGMLFTNMFTSSPHCAPSRAALYTGLYPFRNGAHPNHSEVKPGTRSMAHYMTALGYRAIVTGVTHIKPWKESFPFETLDYVALNERGALEKVLANPGVKPLCIMVCEHGAHDMWPDNRHGYDPAQVNIPPYHVDTPEYRYHRARYYSSITETDHQAGKLLDLLKKSGLEENTLFIFSADHGTGWPHEKSTLYDAGLNTPFIARWPGRIRPGTASDALCSFVDILPTFVEIAGGDVSSVVSQGGGMELDGRSFLPVLLGDRTEHHAEVYGCYTWDVMIAYPMRTIRTRTHKYIWNIDSHFSYPSRWSHDTPHSQPKFRVWQSWLKKAETDPHAAARVRAELFRPPEELYDIRSDPNEMNNLAGDPDQRTVVASLRSKLKAWMQQQGDASDSAYHKEVAYGKGRFLDEIFCHQPVVNVRMSPVGQVGRQTDEVTVTLTSPLWQAEIHYTLDGTEPTRESKLHTVPFVIGPPGPPLTIKAKGFWERGETPVKTVEFTGIDNRFRYYNDHWKPISW